jgi:hypothetical protein
MVSDNTKPGQRLMQGSSLLGYFCLDFLRHLGKWLKSLLRALENTHRMAGSQFLTVASATWKRLAAISLLWGAAKYMILARAVQDALTKPR